jgi:hypothetical protein
VNGLRRVHCPRCGNTVEHVKAVFLPARRADDLPPYWHCWSCGNDSRVRQRQIAGDLRRPDLSLGRFSTDDRVALAAAGCLADGGEACRDMHRPMEARAALRGDVSQPRLWRNHWDGREASTINVAIRDFTRRHGV